MSAPEAPHERVELDFVVTGAQFGEVDWLTDDGVTYAIPCFLAEDSQGNPLFMHWFNTQLRSFPRSPQYDHIDYTNEHGQKQGVMVTPELLEQFRENHYPEVSWYILDPATVKWLGHQAAKSLDAELEELQGGDGQTPLL